MLGSEHSSLIESVSDCLVRNVRLSKLPGVNKNVPMHKTGPAAGLMTFFNPIQLIITAQSKCPHHRFMDIEGITHIPGINSVNQTTSLKEQHGSLCTLM